MELALQVFLEEISSPKVVDIIRGPLPNLRRLALHAVPIKWSEFVAPQLIDLRLINIKHLGPTLLQLLDVLIGCPNLEKVVIKAIPSLEDIPQYLRDRSPVVRLDRLRKIHLSNITPRLTKWLLEAIMMPPEGSVHLQSEVDRNPEDSLFPTNVPDLPAKCLSGGSKILITVRDSYIRLRLDGLWNLHLRSTSMVFVRDLLLWLGLEEGSTKSHVRVEMKWDKLSETQPKDFFNTLDGLQSISFLSTNSKCAYALSHYLGVRNDGVSVSFPGLREISVPPWGRESYIFEVVSDVITNRRNYHQEANTTDCLRAIKFGYPEYPVDWTKDPAPLGKKRYICLLKAAKRLKIQIWWHGALVTDAVDQQPGNLDLRRTSH
ncbi:hypothetical protein FRB90_012530 [Tulasnella sp. 427]|nr:hypothetical protein FRB90_012530 [Tulasnella sp. 427]